MPEGFIPLGSNPSANVAIQAVSLLLLITGHLLKYCQLFPAQKGSDLRSRIIYLTNFV